MRAATDAERFFKLFLDGDVVWLVIGSEGEVALAVSTRGGILDGEGAGVLENEREVLSWLV